MSGDTHNIGWGHEKEVRAIVEAIHDGLCGIIGSNPVIGTPLWREKIILTVPLELCAAGDVVDVDLAGVFGDD